ncbi:hypothetical protein ACFX1T_025406 [Malus domestica]
MTARDVAESSLGIVASHQGDHSSSPLGSILFQLPNEEIHRNRVKYVISGGHTSCHGDICSQFHNARRLQQFGPHEGVTTLLQSVSWGVHGSSITAQGLTRSFSKWVCSVLIAVAVLGNAYALDQRFGRGSNCLIFHHIFSLSKALVNLFLG